MGAVVDPTEVAQSEAISPSSDAKPPQSAVLVGIAMEHYVFGFSTSGECYAVPKAGPRIALMFRGGRTSLRAELAARFCDRESRPPSSSALADALLALEGMAQRLEPTELALRVAMNGREVVLDLGTTSGEVVRVTPVGWSVTRDSPVLFRRSELTAPLPLPVGGGTLEALRELVNVRDESWPLLVAWLVMALLPNLPHPILLLRGEQGAGKSTTAKTVASIVDPSPASLRTAPSDVEQWAVAAGGSWLVPIDNITTIPPWLSDSLCRAVTGDALVKRRLYSDAGLVVLAIRRVVILTSIDAGSLRGDLADRLMPIDLERLDEHERRLDEALAEAFRVAHPAILGALCSLVVDVLAALPGVKLDAMPRMADAARVMAAVDVVLGTDAVGTYVALTKRVAAEVVESDPVAARVRELVAEQGEWTGTPAALLEKIRPEHPPRGWPADATRLSGRLRRAAPTLRSVGIEVDWLKVRGARVVRLSQGDAGAFSVTPASPWKAPSVTLEPAGQPDIRPQGDAGDAKTPTLLCRTQRKIEGGEGQDEGEGKTASLASQRHPDSAGEAGCSRCGTAEVYLTSWDGHSLCRTCVHAVDAERGGLADSLPPSPLSGVPAGPPGGHR